MRSRKGRCEDAINSSYLAYVICACLRIVVSKAYCVVFLTCFSSSWVPYVASFSALSIFEFPFGILWRQFLPSTSPVTGRRCSIISGLTVYITAVENLNMHHIRRRLVRVTRSLVLCVMFCRSLLVFLSIFFCHCVLCLSI